MSLLVSTQAYADDSSVERPAPLGETPTPLPAAPPPSAAPPAPATLPPAAPSPGPVLVAPRAPLVAPRLAMPTLSLAEPSSCAELPDGCPRGAVAPSPAAPEGAEPVRGSSEWYGHQTLIMDGVTLGVGALGISAGSAEAAIAATIMYGAGAPLVHLGNGHPWMALASLATRGSAPFVGGFSGALVGLAAGPRDSNGGLMGPLVGLAVGSVTGVVAAVVLDAAVYSRERKAPPPAWDGKPTLAPTASVTPSGASIGLGGAF